MRLDVFLKKVGLVRQRSLSKEICEKGSVRVEGRIAKASKEISPGKIVILSLRDELIEIEVIDLPKRDYKRKEGEAFYKILKHEYKERFI